MNCGLLVAYPFSISFFDWIFSFVLLNTQLERSSFDPIIKEVEFDVEVASASLIVQVYYPSPSRAYVCLLEVELIRTREALTQVLKDRSHAKKEAHK